VVFVPKYRYRVLSGSIGGFIRENILKEVERAECIVVELNVQPDHCHLLVKVPPKVSFSKLMGKIKGRSAIRVFQKYPILRVKPYWGNHFWAPGYCVDTVGINSEMIRKYVKYQEHK